MCDDYFKWVFLGGIIGDTSGMNSFVSSKVGLWSHYVELLSNITDDQPQLAFIDHYNRNGSTFSESLATAVNCLQTLNTN